MHFSTEAVWFPKPPLVAHRLSTSLPFDFPLFEQLPSGGNPGKMTDLRRRKPNGAGGRQSGQASRLWRGPGDKGTFFLHTGSCSFSSPGRCEARPVLTDNPFYPSPLGHLFVFIVQPTEGSLKEFSCQIWGECSK